MSAASDEPSSVDPFGPSAEPCGVWTLSPRRESRGRHGTSTDWRALAGSGARKPSARPRGPACRDCLLEWRTAFRSRGSRTWSSRTWSTRTWSTRRAWHARRRRWGCGGCRRRCGATLWNSADFFTPRSRRDKPGYPDDRDSVHFPNCSRRSGCLSGYSTRSDRSTRERPACGA